MFVPPGGDGGRGVSARTHRGAPCVLLRSPSHLPPSPFALPWVLGVARRGPRTRMDRAGAAAATASFYWQMLLLLFSLARARRRRRRRLLYHEYFYDHARHTVCMLTRIRRRSTHRAVFSRRVRGLRRTRWSFARFVRAVVFQFIHYLTINDVFSVASHIPSQPLRSSTLGTTRFSPSVFSYWAPVYPRSRLHTCTRIRRNDKRTGKWRAPIGGVHMASMWTPRCALDGGCSITVSSDRFRSKGGFILK